MVNTTLLTFTTQDRIVLLFVHVAKRKIRQRDSHFFCYSTNSCYVLSYGQKFTCLTFGTGVLHLIQINHQPDAIIFQLIILTFVYSSTCFGRFPAHHQELNDCSGSLCFYLRIVVIVVLCSLSGRSAGRPDHEHNTTITTIRR